MTQFTLEGLRGECSLWGKPVITILRNTRTHIIRIPRLQIISQRRLSRAPNVFRHGDVLPRRFPLSRRVFRFSLIEDLFICRKIDLLGGPPPSATGGRIVRHGVTEVAEEGSQGRETGAYDGRHQFHD